MDYNKPFFLAAIARMKVTQFRGSRDDVPCMPPCKSVAYNDNGRGHGKSADQVVNDAYISTPTGRVEHATLQSSSRPLVLRC